MECGKLLVATDADEVRRMEALVERAMMNGAAVTRLTRGALRGGGTRHHRPLLAPRRLDRHRRLQGRVAIPIGRMIAERLLGPA